MAVSDDLLWWDVAVFEALHRKSAATLLAVAGALKRRRELRGAEDEFLAEHAVATSHGDAVFARVWTAPAGCAWAHRAYDLMRMLHAGEPEADRRLAAHLDGFKLFALGAALVGGADHRLDRPLAVRRPIAIPGTRFVLRAPDDVAVHGVAAGRLIVSTASAPTPVRLRPGAGVGGVELRSGPLAAHAGAEIPLGPEIFELPGVEPGDAVRAVPPDPAQQRDGAPVVAAALAVLERHQPEVFAQVRTVLRGVALKPRSAGGFQGMSFSDFPGAFIVSFSPHPFVLAESMVHEFHHNRLFAIESALPLVETDGTDERLHYSPFRPDPRPVRGLLHGLYVFLAVWRFWDQVRRDEELDPLLRAYAVDRVFRVAMNLVIARRQLSRHGGLTEAGRAVLDALASEVEEVVSEIDRSALPLDSPAAFCDAEGRIRLELDERDGKPFTVSDALDIQLRRFASGSDGEAPS